MIIREHYLSQIRPFYESDLVKIITGIRRCGKSVIMKQVMDEIEMTGKECLFLDFDLKPVRNKIPNADALIRYVSERIGGKKLYVFLDEIQNVKEWNEACRSLRLLNCSLFITGSNSKLLSKEFYKGAFRSVCLLPYLNHLYIVRHMLMPTAWTGFQYQRVLNLGWFPCGSGATE